MISRKIYGKMLEWKTTANGTKALLIEGARRIGKSTVAEEFGKKEYKSYVIIDFNKASRKITECFDDITNLDIFFRQYHWSIIHGYMRGNHLLFLMKYRNFQKQGRQ